MTGVVLPDLDAQTVEELRPPCDTTFHAGLRIEPCMRQAEWVTRIRCNDCEKRYVGVMCSEHKSYFFDSHGVATCSAGCKRWPMRYTCLSAERL